MADCIISHKEADACIMTAETRAETSTVMWNELYHCRTGKADITLTITSAICLSVFYHSPAVLDHRHLNANLST